MSDAELENLLDTYGARLEAEGYDARLAAVGAALRGGPSASAAYVLACGVSYAGEEGVGDDENGVLDDLGAALGLSPDQIAALDAEVEGQLGIADA